MKNIYKKIALSFAAFAVYNNTFATDLCVAENGAGGCYSTITAAINAAVDGDRIIIAPKAGNAAYAENLTVTKSLQFLCNTEGGQYALTGNITITPAVGRSITFIGMNNLQGSISASGSSPAGVRCQVSIMNCNFGNGSVNFDYDNFDVKVVSCVFIDGSVALRYGNVIGNDITSVVNYYQVHYYSSFYWCASIYIGTDATPTNDSILVVGNKITYNGAASVYMYGDGIASLTTNQFFYISNNYITTTTLVSSNYPIPLYINSAKNSSLGRNTILNNTVNFQTPTLSSGAIYLSGIPTNAYTDVYNNLLLSGQSGGYGIYNSSSTGPIAVSYNFMSSVLPLNGVVNDGTNNLTSNTTLNVSGKPNSGSDAINGGSLDEAYYDINLTRNDAGAYGGSFTLDNFFPVTGSARVYFISAPRKVLSGGTLNVQGGSFDR